MQLGTLCQWAKYFCSFRNFGEDFIIIFGRMSDDPFYCSVINSEQLCFKYETSKPFYGFIAVCIVTQYIPMERNTEMLLL